MDVIYFLFKVTALFYLLERIPALIRYNELDISITASDFVNKWSHVVASYQSGSKVIYVNGQSIGSNTGITGTLVQAVAPQIIGSNGGGNEFFEGNYPSFKMYNRGISAAEVLQNYNAQKSRFGL